MGILNSVLVGKSRKSAGNITTYQRIGVSCFRQKPTLSPGYKPTVPQLMQQKVFKFFKQNLDASGLMSIVNLYFDAKPRKGKSETRYNMFYRSFMPHLVAEKKAIYELDDDALVDASVFMGTSADNNDNLIQGVLGALNIVSNSAGSLVVSAAALDDLIARANRNLGSSDTPFTTNNFFLAVVGVDKTTSTKMYVGAAANVVPSLASNNYTFNLATEYAKINAANKGYVCLMLAGKTSGGDIDANARAFSTDSIPFQ